MNRTINSHFPSSSLIPAIAGALWLLLSCLAPHAHSASHNDWVAQQKTEIEALSAENRNALKRAEESLAQAQQALALAQELSDSQAEKIAQEAIQIAQDTRDKILSVQKRLGFRLKAVEKVEMQLLDAQPRAHVGVASIRIGDVRIKTSQGWRSLDENTIIQEGDEISTGPDGFMELMFTDGARLNLRANSSFKAAMLGREKTVFEKMEGVAHMFYHCLRTNSRSACNGQSQMRTATAVAAVRGTEYQVMTHPDSSTELIVIKGEVEFHPINEGDAVIVGAGHRAVITKDGKTSAVEKLDLKTIERWWDIPQ